MLSTTREKRQRLQKVFAALPIELPFTKNWPAIGYDLASSSFGWGFTITVRRLGTEVPSAGTLRVLSLPDMVPMLVVTGTACQEFTRHR